jgi:sulfate adenylyltransferase large subunit
MTPQTLLRFSTAGSVDDGKSTLIGRLLYDSKAIFEDQMNALARSAAKRGADTIDLSLLTDGLLAEREQGITIDVAYRYFATPRRKFIIADTPGHEQYTRNMATGASTADLSIILVDARKGLLAQSRRHAIIATLLGVRHLVVAVNKMDLVEYSQEVFDGIRTGFRAFLDKLGVADCRFVPVSALHGDNVVERSARMPWYDGPTLLDVLEQADPQGHGEQPLRFPVQMVSRSRPDHADDGPDGSFRGYLGRIESGTVQPGDRVVLLPGGQVTTVKRIHTWADGRLQSEAVAAAPQSVMLVLADELDVSRGDMIAAADYSPRVVRDIEAVVCWMDQAPLDRTRKYLVKHTTRTTKAVFRSVQSRVDVNTAQETPAGTLGLNDIGRVRFTTQTPLAFDSYRDNRVTGGFILIDELTNHTVAAGMITG